MGGWARFRGLRMILAFWDKHPRSTLKSETMILGKKSMVSPLKGHTDLICCDEERAELEAKALCSLDNLRCNAHLMRLR